MIKEVADIEVYPTLFVYVGHSASNEEKYEYVLHSTYNNNISIWCDRMRSGIKMIGFNNINYDYPVIHFILTNEQELKVLSSEELCYKIYQFSKDLIETEERVWINPKEYIVPQLDLFQIHHFGNKARRTSLKAIEVALRMDSIEDLPFDPHEHVTVDKVKTIVDYCHHDVSATKLFYLKSINEIKMRIGLSNTYDLDLLNANDPKIGSEIILKLVSQAMGEPFWEVRKMRTYRNGGIPVKDLIIDTIKFNTKEFQQLLDHYKKLTVYDTKGDVSYSVNFNDVQYDYGTGGIHACNKSGIYKSDNAHMILDIDVRSFYPNIAIQNRMGPQHLGKAFPDVYETLYDERAQYPKGSPENYGIKIALNGAFGKMNDIYSFLYDPKCLLFITINGQLLISMLTESILTKTGAILLQANTDGITIRFKRSEYQLVKNLMKQWEDMTSLILEEVEYKSMFIIDVNNYMSIDTNDKCKFKGSFEIDKMWHKDISHRIVSIAVARWCIYGIDPNDTLKNHLNIERYDDLIIDGKPCISYGIFDFCGAKRARGGAKYETEQIIDGQHIIKSLPKTNRYFVSNKGVRMRKVLPPDTNKLGATDKFKQQYPNQMNIFDIVEDVVIDKNRVSYIEAGNNVIIFNKKFNEPYDINYKYYLNECYKLIDKLQ